MLKKKSNVLTKVLFDSLDIGLTESQIVTVQAVILKYLETTYLQGRHDQVDMVTFEQDLDGSLTFRSE